jgi:hypothetical protein
VSARHDPAARTSARRRPDGVMKKFGEDRASGLAAMFA